MRTRKVTVSKPTRRTKTKAILRETNPLKKRKRDYTDPDLGEAIAKLNKIGKEHGMELSSLDVHIHWAHPPSPPLSLASAVKR